MYCIILVVYLMSNIFFICDVWCFTIISDGNWSLIFFILLHLHMMFDACYGVISNIHYNILCYSIWCLIFISFFILKLYMRSDASHSLLLYMMFDVSYSLSWYMMCSVWYTSIMPVYLSIRCWMFHKVTFIIYLCTISDVYSIIMCDSDISLYVIVMYVIVWYFL